MSEHDIERLGHHGDGIAEGPVFVPLTLPGERVSGDIVGNRLADPKILRPSPDRVTPPCRHFKHCGGCQLQHASDDLVAAWKVDVVRQALAAQGVSADFRPIVTSPAQSRRRAALSVRRTKKGALAGFHSRGTNVIAEIPDCQLLHPDLMPALKVAEALAVLGASRKAELTVTATLSRGGVDIAARGGKEPDGPLLARLAQAAEAHGLARLSWNDEVIATRLPPIQVFGKAEVSPPPGAFLQATEEGEAALVMAVKEAVGSAAKVIDLFAGCGTFALPLAEGARVHAVEGDRAMTRALEDGWRMASGLKHVTTEARDLFRNPVIVEDLRYDAAVIDPPRAGAEAQVRELAASAIPRIAFVSCNPATFARDAAILISSGYTLDWVQVVDQFRWSAHVELAALFTRGKA
ncbi:23S rRNA m(5)U-1939 methyltransferase [Salinihabitans flavidus]|uniref:23S rRNA m(5)U-1939 methyltransferase n=1 Tax=Salinihabitans flavidus TaxID=569882 RepID=A0A1H8LWR7_9RHOB|nr:class I SAM-dependent RNA methyltransferase [Salinihabitans flavidus]SEO09594.1 23S rRNA m(5)U-1939 methyltransferase [Salinihabitans flavidus]